MPWLTRTRFIQTLAACSILNAKTSTVNCLRFEISKYYVTVRHYDMPKYDLPSKHSAGFENDQLETETVESMWLLFAAICARWQNIAEPLTMKTRFLGFLSNRIELHPEYVSHYRTAATVITELREVHGDGAYEFLFTDPNANIAPPQTPLHITRQL